MTIQISSLEESTLKKGIRGQLSCNHQNRPAVTQPPKQASLPFVMFPLLSPGADLGYTGTHLRTESVEKKKRKEEDFSK